MSGKEPLANVKFEKFVEDVPIPGTKEIYTSQSVVEKVVWVLILLGGTILTAYYVFKVFAEYRENKTATKVVKFVVCYRYSVAIRIRIIF